MARSGARKQNQAHGHEQFEEQGPEGPSRAKQIRAGQCRAKGKAPATAWLTSCETGLQVAWEQGGDQAARWASGPCCNAQGRACMRQCPAPQDRGDVESLERENDKGLDLLSDRVSQLKEVGSMRRTLELYA